MIVVERVFTYKVRYAAFEVGDVVRLIASDADDMPEEYLQRERVVRDFWHPSNPDEHAIVYFEGEPNGTGESAQNCVLVRDHKEDA